MGQLAAVHYKAKKVILAYLGLLVMLLGAFSGGDVTYTRFLTYPPGLYLLYLACAILAWLIVWRLPYFVRAIFRVPALEYDGRKLVVRGWNIYQIASEDLPDTAATFGKSEAIILKAPNLDKPISIDLRFVWETPAISLIENLTLRQIAPFRAMQVAQPLMTDEQKAARTRRKAWGYFLIGLGLPSAAAFIYPLLATRRGPIVDFQSLSASDGRVFLIGGSVGIVVAAIGYLLLRASRRH
jgi:hypothetical protein